MGAVLKMFAAGRDITSVRHTDHVQAIKSVGNGCTAPRDLVTDNDVRIMLYLLSDSVAMRLRELGSRCTVVEVYIRDNELNLFTRQRKLETATCSSAEIAETAFDLFKRNYYWARPIRGVGVRGSGLVELSVERQLSVYSDDQKRDKLECIDNAMDTLRQKYGYLILQRAIVQTDPLLAKVNPSEDEIHPVGYFAG